MNLKQYFESRVREYSEKQYPIDLTGASVRVGKDENGKSTYADLKLSIYIGGEGQTGRIDARSTLPSGNKNAGIIIVIPKSKVGEVERFTVLNNDGDSLLHPAGVLLLKKAIVDNKGNMRLNPSVTAESIKIPADKDVKILNNQIELMYDQPTGVIGVNPAMLVPTTNPLTTEPQANVAV